MESSNLNFIPHSLNFQTGTIILKSFNKARLFVVAFLFSFSAVCLAENSPSHLSFFETTLTKQGNPQTFESVLKTDGFQTNPAPLFPFSTNGKTADKSRRLLLVKAAQIRRQNRSRRQKAQVPKSFYYESCKGVDPLSLSSDPFPSTQKTEAGSCLDCGKRQIRGRLKEIKETGDILQTEIFKQKLQKRVIGQVEAKIFKTRLRRACIEEDRSWFKKHYSKTDWPLMRAVCRKQTRALRSAVENQWSDMRVSLALSAPSVREDRILPNISTWMDLSPSHSISGFESLPKLNRKEISEAKERYAEGLGKVPLDRFSGKELKARLLKGERLPSLFLGDEDALMGADQQRLKQAEMGLREENRRRYSEILSARPELAYLKTGHPKPKELARAFHKVEAELKEFLKKVKDPEAETGLLLSFKPLVEDLLKEDKGFCLSAEKARLQAERDEKFENYISIGVGVLAAVPCFAAGPIGASLCLAGGVGLGAVGLKQAQAGRAEALGRALTGAEFETIGGLEKKERELFLAKLFLPLGAYGTTAIPARFAADRLGRAFKTASKNVEDKAAGGAKKRVVPEEKQGLRSFDFRRKMNKSGERFYQNFKEGRLDGDNQFISLRNENGHIRVGRVIKKDDNRYVLVELIEPSSGEVKKTLINVSEGNVYLLEEDFRKIFPGVASNRIEQGSPGLKAVFESLESGKKRIRAEELHLSSRTREEQTLKEQGFGSAYTKGIDDVNEWVEVKKRLKELKANPQTTHIDYFADKVEGHIEYVREALKAQTAGGLDRMRLIRLEQLEKKAKQTVESGGVTYKWWLEFNQDLSIVYDTKNVTGSKRRSGKKRTRKLLHELMAQFPENILMPTTKGEVGVIALNRAGAKGVYPVGLTTKTKNVDGEDMDPHGFFYHDLFHAHGQIISGGLTDIVKEQRILHDKLTKTMESLPPEKRKKVEFAYFILTHEVAHPSYNLFVEGSSELKKRAIVDVIRAEIGKGVNFKGLMDFPVDRYEEAENAPEIRRQIADIADEFLKALEQGAHP